MYRFFVAATAAAAAANPALADDSYTARIDDHAPIGVMAEHAHKQGEAMVSLRAMTMRMGGPANVMMGPQSMTMNMVMAGFMYAPSDKVTLTAMVNYSDSSMDMVMGGTTMEMSSSDFGDVRLGAIVPLLDTGKDRFLVGLSASVPIGSTADTAPLGARMALTMQPGTGSWGLTPSATYTHFFDHWSFGAQANAKFWLDDNDQGERMGDSLEFTSWAAVQASNEVSMSARISYLDQEAVSGSMATMLTDGREELRAFGGLNILVGSHRFALEAGVPLWQDRGGNNLRNKFTLLAGWQKAF